tara:strand:+ start:165 stop:389 length:225 start_codon:yes stop_codon:yes gene_type:complete
MRETDYHDFMAILKDGRLSQYLTEKERKAMRIVAGAYLLKSYDHSEHSQFLITARDATECIWHASRVLKIIGGK